MTFVKPRWKDFTLNQELLGDGMSYKSLSGDQLTKFFITKIVKTKSTFDQLIDMVIVQNQDSTIDN